MRVTTRKYFFVGIAIALLLAASYTVIPHKQHGRLTVNCVGETIELQYSIVAGCNINDHLDIYNPGGNCGIFKVEYKFLPDGEGFIIDIPKIVYIKGGTTVRLNFTVHTSVLLAPNDYHLEITLTPDCPTEQCGDLKVMAIHSFILHWKKAYFKVKITESPNLNGEYRGWCLDIDTNMRDGKKYSASEFTSYSKLAHPENLDLVNYILNKDYVGHKSKCGGRYTYGDVQRAIWVLIEDHLSSTYIETWKKCRVNEIVADAKAHGEGFVPTKAGQVVGVILEPCESSKAQICIIEVPYGKYHATP